MSSSTFLVLAFGLSLLGGTAFGQPVKPEKFWEPVSEIPQQRSATATGWIQPNVFYAFNLNPSLLHTTLARAPLEFSKNAQTSSAEILLPMPDGTSARFTLVESPVMEPELAAKFPEIKTYLGQGVDDPAATVRLDFTPAGFHAQILSPNGAVYIDPYFRGDAVLHTSYFKKDYQKVADDFHCLVEEAEKKEAALEPVFPEAARSGGNLRTYRLACAATGEYTAFHGGTVATGLSAIVTAINRVTGVYEAEVAIRLVLVASNNSIIYTNANTDPYSNTDGSALLTQNQTNLDAVIGAGNYDIGHVFSTGGGGLAALGVVCRSGVKARGETGSPTPINDSFYIDYVAHEMGHQFGANHTFNSTSGSCSGNRVSSAAYEIGCGSTILAYAGLCDPDNTQQNSDPYFHAKSFDEIIAYSTTGFGNGCPVLTATGNSVPTVSAGSNYTIPRNTPFTLTANGSDPDGDALTYCWEELDLGAAQTLAAADNGSSPLFRSFSPTTNASRIFPKLSALLANTASLGEKLPTLSRTMNFRVTARDNRANGGGVNTSDMQVTVNAAAGPFVVSAPNTAVVWSGPQTVTWSVAGTTAAPVNTATVNILLSMDGGNTFPVVLATNTPNDGSETILLPSIMNSTARIKVEGNGNIFFDVSDVNFSIVPFGPAVVIQTTALTAENCAPTNHAIDPGETVSVNFALQNMGTANTTNLIATLLATNGIVSPGAPQNYGALVAGGSATVRTFSFTASGSCGGTIQAVLQLQDGLVNLGTVTNLFLLGGTVSQTFSKTNTTAITIPDVGPALLYPSTNFIAGAQGVITKVTVSLLGLTHTFPDDLDILLVGPNNQSVLLMSDAGGNFPISGINPLFDSILGSALPNSGQLVSTTYLPSNYDNNSSDSFPFPAPAAPWGASFTVFNGISPNGTWSLYITDDSTGDSGSLDGGWQLNVTTSSPICCTSDTPSFIQSVTRSGSSVTLVWTAIPGRTYQLQYTTSLNPISWMPVAGNIMAVNTTATKTDPGATTDERYYRIVLLP
ncbi:MAG: reprolysin-like metallopeptidase [Verrucomicrobiota bacterium]